MTQKRARVSWNLECVNKTFLEACVHELTANGGEGSRSKRSSWKVVAEKLKNDHSFIVDYKQMKNRYDYLEAKYLVWLKLKNKRENVYNPITNTFSMSDEEWDAEAKLNKFVNKLRNVPLPFPDLCTKLFDGNTSTDIHNVQPLSTFPYPAEKFSKHDVDDVQSTQMGTPTSRGPPLSSEESSAQSRQKAGTRTSKEDCKNTLDEELIKVGNAVIDVAKMLVEKYNIGNDIEACMEKLEKMEWGEEDPRYITALLLFGESVDIRKIWLCLKPASCELWVRNAGKKFGLLG